jgi:hypothetical protein
MKDKPKRTLSWNPGVDPETEDREAFLKLSYVERWNYIMEIVLATYPARVAPAARRRLLSKSGRLSGNKQPLLP